MIIAVDVKRTMDLQLPVLRVLLAHPSGATKKRIAEKLGAALGED